MCTRFSFVVSAEKMRRQFNLPSKTELQQSYNIGAGQNAYVLTGETPELRVFRWGLLPYWAKGESAGNNLINVAAEGIETKLSFRIPIRQRRCIVFADSYYEWQRNGRQMQAYRVMHRDSSIMAFAGVWDEWTNPADQKKYNTFSVITTTANQDISGLSQRMPVLLRSPEEWVKWLANETPLNEVLAMLKAPADRLLEAYPISNAVEDLANNYPDLHKELR